MDMEAVEIKTEPLDEHFNQIVKEEVIIKSENEMDYTSLADIHSREPEVQISENRLEPKEEPTKEPEESLTPERSPNEDRLREEINSEIVSNHCKFCNLFFKSRTTLRLHERNCQYKNDCRLCGQKFVTSYALSTHLSKTHNRMMENVSPQKETTKSSLDRTSNINPCSSDNQCDVCSLKFANSRDLNNHKKKHNTCQQCGENLKSYEDLKKHICENVAVKEEDQSETETPTKQIFRATNSMVVIPSEEGHTHTPVRSNAKVKNAKPKKRKSRRLFHENDNESSSDNENGKPSIENITRNSSPKSCFSVVTRDTDFEAFAQQMMKGFTDVSDPLPERTETESISDQILRKLQVPSDAESKDGECEQLKFTAKTNLIKKADASQTDNVIVDSEGNIYKILKENFVRQSALIKDEPLDEAEPDEEAEKPKMPLPLPFIKDEPPDQQAYITDSTDFLLEELFDRKAKSIAKVRQTKFPFNPSFEPNGLGFKVKKEINVQKSFDFESKAPNSSSSSPKKKNKSYTLKNKSSIQNVVLRTQSLPLTVSHISRRKALPHKIKDEILENITPELENHNQTMSKKSKNITLKFVPTKTLPTQKLLTKLLPTKPLPPSEALTEKSLTSKKLPVRDFISNPKNVKTVNRKLPTLKNSSKSKRSKLLISQNAINELYRITGKGYLTQGLKMRSEYLNEHTILGDINSITEENSSTASLIGARRDEISYSADYNCTTADADHIPIDDNACSGDVEMTCTEDLGSIKTGGLTCKESHMNSTSDSRMSSTIEEQTSDITSNDNSSQQPSIGFEIPSDGDFDFEEVIRSNKLPNFNNVSKVIKNLTEEYQKAEKVKLEDAPPLIEVDSQAKQVLPEAVEEQNKPTSLFFPMLDDTQVYNMVANALNEKYRYVWICPLCPRQYSQIRPFKKHLLTIHFKSSSELEGQAFELRPELVLEAGPNETFCHLCHVTLADNATLRKHQVEMHKEQDLTLRQKKKPLLHRCYICTKLCSSRTLLAEHMKSDCGKNPQYGCNVCDKKFHTKSTLNLHKTMHTGELPHSCGFCQKRFRTRGQLTVHTRTHTGEKPFPCKVCGQCFTHRETLIAHLSRHIDMKRYKCYGCDQFFSCISGLKTHRSVRPETCGRVELNARAVGPRVRVIKGNVIFEPQPIYNARLAKVEKPILESYILDHNYYRKDPYQTKKVSKQTIKNETMMNITPKNSLSECFF